jgi:hypothetical protein
MRATPKILGIPGVCCVILAAVFHLSSESAQAAVATLNPIADTTVQRSDAGSTNNYNNWGSSIYLSATIYGSNPDNGAYSLLRFDLSSLPTDSIITGATLTLSAGGGNYSYSRNEVLRVWQITEANAAWVQGTSDAAPGNGATARYLNQTSYTNVSNNTGTDWASGGIFSVAPGDLGDEVGSLGLTSIANNTPITITLSASTIQSWLANPNLATAGLALHMTNDGTNTGNTHLNFNSMNSSVASNLLPQLQITYTAVPEPGVLGMLALGACLFAGRRRIAQRFARS